MLRRYWITAGYVDSLCTMARAVASVGFESTTTTTCGIALQDAIESSNSIREAVLSRVHMTRPKRSRVIGDAGVTKCCYFPKFFDT